MSKIEIRPLYPEDAKTSWRWRNDLDVWTYTGKKPNLFITEEIERIWIEKVLKEKNSKRYAIIVDNCYVGNIQLTQITKNDAEYHIFIGDKKFWGRGVAFSASQQLIKFAITELNLKSIYLTVNPSHLKAIQLYEKIGFVKISNEVKMELNFQSNNLNC